MPSDFNTLPARRGTGSLKWDREPELLPFWVADMDHPSPEPIIQALHQRVNHGVFGYALPHTGLIEAITEYLQRRMGTLIEEPWLVHLGGVVPALSLAARAFCAPGDQILTCTPVYPPFLGIHRDAQAQLLTVDHCLTPPTPDTKKPQWTFDWEKLETTVTPKTKIFILSNPQNPLGRVFTRPEIEQLAHFCQRHNLILISDEIHCDLILDETQTPHTSALHLPEELLKRTITLLAPSKTYNIAGLGYAYAIIPDDSLRRTFTAARGHTLAEINTLGYYAAEAAYRHGEPWRQELLAHLRTNRHLLTTYCHQHLPGILIPDIQATYLAWLDFRNTQWTEPAKIAQERAQLFLSDGTHFGWPGCLRLNFGCPTSLLQQGLTKLHQALTTN